MGYWPQSNSLRRGAKNEGILILKPTLLPLVIHKTLTRFWSKTRPSWQAVTKLDHYFISLRTPLSRFLNFDDIEVSQSVLERLGWYVAGADLEANRSYSDHLLIQTTYPEQGYPNIEVSLRAREGERWLDLESIYLHNLARGGLGACALWHCAQTARSIGCQYIALQGAGSSTGNRGRNLGHYAWVRMGFNGELTVKLRRQLAQIDSRLIACATAREALNLNPDAWKKADVVIPLRFNLEQETSDLPFLQRYLASKNLLMTSIDENPNNELA